VFNTSWPLSLTKKRCREVRGADLRNDCPWFNAHYHPGPKLAVVMASQVAAFDPTSPFGDDAAHETRASRNLLVARLSQKVVCSGMGFSERRTGTHLLACGLEGLQRDLACAGHVDWRVAEN